VKRTGSLSFNFTLLMDTSKVQIVRNWSQCNEFFHWTICWQIL